MIRIVVDDAGALSSREATALGHMFMHLAGHSLQVHDETPQQRYDRTGEIVLKQSDSFPDACVPGNRCENSPENYPVPPPPMMNSPKGYFSDIHANAQDESYFEDEMESCSMENPQEDTTMAEELIRIAAAPMQEVLRDSAGIRWDDRIHAKNKAKTASGLWKLGRNLSSDHIKKVQAELRAEVASCLAPVTTPAPAVPVPPPTVLVPATFLHPAITVPSSVAPAVPMPPPPVLSVPVPPPVAVPVPPINPQQTNEQVAATLFDALLEKVTKGVEAKLFTMQAVVNTIRSFKDANGNPICMHMGAVANRPDLVPAITAELDRIASA